MFIILWWLIMFQIKNYGAIVSDLNLQSENEGFKSSTCNFGLLKFFV